MLVFAFRMLGAVFMREGPRREMNLFGVFRRREPLGFALCRKFGKPLLVPREVVPAIGVRAAQGFLGEREPLYQDVLLLLMATLAFGEQIIQRLLCIPQVLR